jgi:hydroxymethylglutaryl-CoA reductase
MMNLETMLSALSRLSNSNKPLWGKMNAQEMVEHLSDMLMMARGTGNFTIDVDAETIARRQQFLLSDKEMAKNIAVPFTKELIELSNDELELAVDEFTDEWINFIELYENNPDASVVHPYYGALDFNLWLKMHDKHFMHHFKQFGLIE